MRFFLFVCILLYFSACKNNGQKKIIQTDSICIVPNFGVERNLKLKIKKITSKRYQYFKTCAVYNSDVALKMKLCDQNKWHCNWKVLNLKCTDKDYNLDNVFSKIILDLDFEFTIDSIGNINLINYNNLYYKGLAKVKELSKDKKYQNNKCFIRNMQSKILSFFENKENLEGYIMDIPQTFFALSNIEINKSDTISNEIEVGNGISGDVYIQKNKFYLDEISPNNTCSIKVEYKSDNIGYVYKNTLTELMGTNMVDKLESKKKIKSFYYKGYMDYIINFKTGLTQKVRSTKVTKCSLIKQVDFVSISIE